MGVKTLHVFHIDVVLVRTASQIYVLYSAQPQRAVAHHTFVHRRLLLVKHEFTASEAFVSIEASRRRLHIVCVPRIRRFITHVFGGSYDAIHYPGFRI